jgi:hypothetical protein
MLTKVLIVLLFLPASAMAQAHFSFNVNYGTYLMTQMKSLEEEIPASFPVHMKTLSNYPPYFNFDGSFTYQTEKSFFWGFVFGYGSTGGRMHYSDYSGFVLYDQRIKYFSAHGSVGLAKKYPTKNLQLDFDLRPGIMFTRYLLVVDYEVASTTGGESNNFKSTNFVIQPTTKLRKRFGPFGVEAVLGINVNFIKGKLFLEDNKEVYLIKLSGEPVRADWTGVRLGLGACYYF